MNQQNVNDEEPPHSVNANNYEDDDNSDYGSDKEEEDNEDIRLLLYNDAHNINNNDDDAELEDVPTQEHLGRSGNGRMIPVQSNIGTLFESAVTPTTRKRRASDMLTTPNTTSLPSTNNNNINHNKRMRTNEQVVQHQQQQPHHLPHSYHPVSSPLIYNNQTGIMPNNIQHPNIYPLPLQPPGTPSQQLAHFFLGMCSQLVGNGGYNNINSSMASLHSNANNNQMVYDVNGSSNSVSNFPTQQQNGGYNNQTVDDNGVVDRSSSQAETTCGNGNSITPSPPINEQEQSTETESKQPAGPRFFTGEDGYEYRWTHQCTRGRASDYYVCKHYGSTGCCRKARIYRDNGEKEYFGRRSRSNNQQNLDQHLPSCSRVHTVTSNAEEASNNIPNVKVQVWQLIDEVVSQNMALTAGQVYTEVNGRLVEEHGAWTGATSGQIKARVYEVKKRLNGGDAFTTIETQDEYRLYDDGSGAPFLYFNVSRTGIDDKNPGVIHRAMGFSHPRLVKKLKGRNHCYVDCTFASTPRPFVQTLNFMMFDDETQSYVCVFWVLLTGQFEKLYAETLHQIWIATDRKLNPLSLTLDYEDGLINAGTAQFIQAPTPYLDRRGETKIDGCLFHWKQAIRRWMIKNRIKRDHVKFAMRKGVLDLLCVIPHKDLESKGIPFVKSLLKAKFGDSMQVNKWAKFWKYFFRQWMTKRLLPVWNLFDKDGHYIMINNRTNNGLERYNRHQNSLFHSPHPTLFVYIKTIQKEALRIVNRLDDQNWTEEEHKELTIPDIPKEYYDMFPEEVTVRAPLFGLTLEMKPGGVGALVQSVHNNSVLAQQISKGDSIISMDGKDVSQMNSKEISTILESKASNVERELVVVKAYIKV